MLRTPFPTLLAGSALALACGNQSSSKHPTTGLPEVVVVRVDRVAVLPVRPGTNAHWDGPVPESRAGEECKLLAWGAQIAWSPVAAEGVRLLCGLSSRSEPAERDAQAPDLKLRLTTGGGARFESFTSADAATATFQYGFVIPTQAIPPEGLLLEVLDDDAASGGETIGSARVNRETLSNALSAPDDTIDLHNGAVSQLELVVTPYAPIKIPLTPMQASSEPRQLAPRPLAAGEIVSLRATGSYTVGSWYDKRTGPGGYLSAEPARYNFKQEPFAKAPHACAIALIGERNSVEGFVVGASATRMVHVGGQLRAGVNDIEPENNVGVLSFEGDVRAPTAEEWRAAR
jgi:hypothetical protein